MKHLFAVLSVLWVLFGVLSLEAQPKYVIVWADTLDNGGSDYARGIAVDGSGNIYVTGGSSNGSNNDYLTVKYNASGNILWVDTLDNGSWDEASGIAVDTGGNVYVTGYSTNGSNWDYLTVKYNASGNILWADTLDNGGNDAAYGIAVDGSGNVYVTGYSYNGSNNDCLTLKYDSLGNIVWADTLDNDSTDAAYGIAVDGSGNVYITGFSYIGSNDDYLTVKYDSLGNIVWSDTLDNGSADYGQGIAVNGSGNVYVTGYSYNGSNNDYLTVKYDSLGNIVWVDTLDHGSADYGQGIAVNGSGNVYVTGYSGSGSNYDYLTVKYDSLGNIVWENTLDNGSDDAAHGIAVDGSGNVYVTGQSYIGSNYDYLTVKYGKYKDAGILSIVSPDTVCIDSSYIPQIWVKNNSYEDTLSFDVSAYIDTSGANIYADTQSVSNLPVGDSVLVSFSQWTAPSNPVDLNLSFSILISDMNVANDTISKPIYVRDLIPPVIDSAIASDGTNPVSGIDDDDYVTLYFSEPTNKPGISNSNIDIVLSLSGGHTWLDGAGYIGGCNWNIDGDQLQINLTTNASLPTIAVGDTITPDGATIQDGNGNPCSSPIVLGGTFEPAGIKDRRIPMRTMLNVSTINKGSISFSYGIAREGTYNISLYTIDGRIIKKIEGKGKGYHSAKFSNLPSGIYFIRLEQEEDVVNKKVILVR